MTYYRKAKPVFFVSLATIFFGFFVVIKPSASLILLQSFPNSSLWRERYLDSRQHKQGQEDFYEILGVSRDANQENIKIAFRQLVKEYHPDANPNTDTTEKFQKINRAYQTLSDTRRRRKYNSQMYNHGFSDDTPNFIIDAFEDGSQPLRPKSTATTDAIPYQPNQLEPNNNGRGSLLKNDEDDDGKGTDGAYRIRCL